MLGDRNAGRKIEEGMRSSTRDECCQKKQKWLCMSVLLPTLLYKSEGWICQRKYKNNLNTVGKSYLRNMYAEARRNMTKKVI